MDCAACHQPFETTDGASACPRCGQPVDDPWIGRLLGERYRLLAPLGRGGMGTVYRAEHVLMKKEMAVKLLHPELGRIDEVARRFEREAQSASRLDHPNIISVTDFGRADDGTLFLVMERLVGEPLTALLAHGPLALPRAAALLTQVLRALESAHAQGVVHRDLKPDNVFLVRREGEDAVENAAGGRVKLLDFGIARLIGGATGESLTQAGVVFGTPEYISPEQAIGEVADGRADLYAAGVMLFEMLTGARPFHSDSKVTLISMHLTRPPPSLREVLPGGSFSPAIEKVVQRALEKSRDKRYPDAHAFREELAAAAVGSAASPPTLRPSSSRWAVAAPATAARMAERVVGRARAAGVPYPRVVVAAVAALALAMITTLAVVLLRPPAPRPTPPPPSVSEDLKRAEELLARGDLPAARAALQTQLSTHGDVARVHYLLATLHFAERELPLAMVEYREAIRLDSGYRGDAALLTNARLVLDAKERPLADSAQRLLVEDVGAPGIDRLVDCARTCREMARRRAAADAVVRLGGAGALPKELAAGDGELSRLVDELENGKSCKERRRAATDLRDLGDVRAVEALKRARERRGGFLGLERSNGCALRDIDDALRVLGAKSP